MKWDYPKVGTQESNNNRIRFILLGFIEGNWELGLY